MSAWSTSEMLAQAYADWTKAVRADDVEAMRRAAAASKANGGPDYADVLAARETCPGTVCTTASADARLCAWHFWRWWTRPAPQHGDTSDRIHCGAPLEWVADFGMRAWVDTDALDYDNNGEHCAVTDEEHQPYSIDLQAAA